MSFFLQIGAGIFGLFLLYIFFGLVGHFYLTTKYREEFQACMAAVMANNADMADEINQRSIHFYVVKAFYARSKEGKIDVGYRLSIGERRRERGWAGGSFDGTMGF